MIRSKSLSSISRIPEPLPEQPDLAKIIGQAIIESSRNSDNAAMVIANALHSLPQPTIAPNPPSSWEFKIIRDSDGNITTIKATSK